VSVSLTEAKKNAAKFPPSKTVAEHILIHAQDSRPVVQEFVPLAESMEWELGQQYFRDRGNKAFISDTSPVPFVINNDGNLWRNAAELFFKSLLEPDKAESVLSSLQLLCSCAYSWRTIRGFAAIIDPNSVFACSVLGPRISENYFRARVFIPVAEDLMKF
jgi:hypothetical protein